MPISEKIIEQVSSSDISENEKSLILGQHRTINAPLP